MKRSIDISVAKGLTLPWGFAEGEGCRNLIVLYFFPTRRRTICDYDKKSGRERKEGKN